jgi:lipopolysaccharide export system permease protein
LKKLDRYLVTNVTKFLLVTELAGLVVFLTIDFFEHLDAFTASLANFALSLAYLMLRIPYFFNLMLPIAFLISMLIILVVMIRSNEMMAIRTSGISTVAIMKPLFIFSASLVVLSFVLAEWVIPRSAEAADYIYRIKIKKEEPYVFLKNDRIWYKRDATVTNIAFFDTKTDSIKGLTVLELGKDYSIQKRIDAKEGQWKDGSWTFTGVVERTFSANGTASRKAHARMKGIVREPPAVFKVVERNPEEMGYSELNRYIEKLRREGHEVRRYLVDLYDKVAFPFVNFIMVFAAFSVGLRYTKTRHVSTGILAGLVLGVFYLFLHNVFLTVGYSEVFPPLFAAWFSNLLFFAAGIIGIVTLRT